MEEITSNNFDWVDLIPDHWDLSKYRDIYYSMFTTSWGHIEYPADFEEILSLAINLSIHPVAIALATIDGSKFPLLDVIIEYGSDGLKPFIHGSDKNVRPGNYLIILSPTVILESGTRDVEAQDAI